MGLETLPQAIQSPQIGVQLAPQEVAWAGEALSDETALAIVLSDTIKAEQIIQGHNAALDWENWDNLYRAIPRKDTWPGTESARAALALPVILEAIEKLMPAIYLAFFSDKQPFLLEPLGRTTPQAARALAHLLQWAVKEADFAEQIRLALKSALLYGTLLFRTGWKVETRRRDRYEINEGRVERHIDEYQINHPTCDRIELRSGLVDPSCRQQDCRKGRYVITQMYMGAAEIEELADDPTYKNIPSRDELTQALALAAEATPDSMMASKYTTWRDLQSAKPHEITSVDPTKQPLEVLEYVSDSHIITVLERLIVIRNDVNEDRSKNHFSCNFIDVPGSFYGFGVAKLLSGEHLLQNSVANKWLDALALLLNPAFTEQKGLATGSQQVKVSPGKILSSVGQLTPISVPDVTKAATEAIAASEARAARRVGANGGDNMPTQAMRTAEGVNAFERGLVDKLQYFIEIFSNLVFIPALESMLTTCKRNLQPDDIKKILQEAEADLVISNVLDIYNGTVSISTLSSTKLAARRAAAQLVPLFMQLLSAEPFQLALAAQGKKFDMVEFLEEVVDLAGWDVDSFIVDASPAEIQRIMMSQPGVAQAQAAQQTQQNQLQNELQVVEAQGNVRAGVQVIKHVLQESGKLGETEALTQSLPGT